MSFNCIIPAGGFGTRLGALTIGIPKAFLPLGKGTVLEHIFARLAELEDLKEICIVTNDVYYKLFSDWANEFSGPKKLHVISDGSRSNEVRLGANKGTWFGVEKMGWENSDLLIMGSDNFIPVPLDGIAKSFTKGDSSVVAVCDYGSKDHVKRLVVPTMEGNVVTHIEEKPAEPRTTLGCPLIYLIKAKDLKYLKQLASDEKDNIGHLLEMIQKESKLCGYLFKEKIVDIGTPADYASVQR